MAVAGTAGSGERSGWLLMAALGLLAGAGVVSVSVSVDSVALGLLSCSVSVIVVVSEVLAGTGAVSAGRIGSLFSSGSALTVVLESSVRVGSVSVGCVKPVPLYKRLPRLDSSGRVVLTWAPRSK
jgi:hypothetical protein